MEFSVRDWMVIIGVLLVLAVVLDGYRRMRNERRNNLRISLSSARSGVEDDDGGGPNPELPNGGARVVSGRAVKPPARGETPVSATRRRVPVLLETAPDAGGGRDEADNATATADGRAEDDGYDAGEDAAELDDDWREPYDPELGSIVPSRDDDAAHDERANTLVAGPDPDADDIDDAESPDPRQAEADTWRDPLFEPAPPPRQEREAPGSAQPVDEVIIINALARERSRPFAGPDLLQILLSCDLRHGRMNIFHRHEQAGGRGAIQFSVANLVEPGTFDLDGIAGFSTPGVCFFMTLPGPEDPLRAFDYMVETAQCLVKNLEGELRDEAHSAMTVQTLEHCRERIREFERRQLTQHS